MCRSTMDMNVPKQGGLYCPSLISTRIRQNPVGISFGPETSQIWKFILVDSGWNARMEWQQESTGTESGEFFLSS